MSDAQAVSKSVYVSWCHRCGNENRQAGAHVVCLACGAEYWLKWPCEED